MVKYLLFGCMALFVIVLAGVTFFGGRSLDDYYSEESDLDNDTLVMAMDALEADAPPAEILPVIVSDKSLLTMFDDITLSMSEEEFDANMLRVWLAGLSDEEITALQPSMAAFMRKRIHLLQSPNLSKSDQRVSRNAALLFDTYLSVYGERDGAQALEFVEGLPLELGAVPYVQTALRAWLGADRNSLEKYILEVAKNSQSNSNAIFVDKTLQYYFEVLSEESDLDLDRFSSTDGMPVNAIKTAMTTVLLDDDEGAQLQIAAELALKYQDGISDPQIYKTIADRLAEQSPAKLDIWALQIADSDAARAIATGVINRASEMQPAEALGLLSGSGVTHLAALSASVNQDSHLVQADYLDQYVAAALTRIGENREAALNLYREFESVDPSLSASALNRIKNTMRLRYGAEKSEELLGRR